MNFNFKKSQKTDENFYKKKNNQDLTPTLNLQISDDKSVLIKSDISQKKNPSIEDDKKELNSILGKPL